MDTTQHTPLEGADQLITLARAAEIAGLVPASLRQRAIAGRLRTVRPARDSFTTRRWLHEYLTSRTGRPDRAAPLPPTYLAPEG